LSNKEEITSLKKEIKILKNTKKEIKKKCHFFNFSILLFFLFSIFITLFVLKKIFLFIVALVIFGLFIKKESNVKKISVDLSFSIENKIKDIKSKLDFDEYFKSNFSNSTSSEKKKLINLKKENLEESEFDEYIDILDSIEKKTQKNIKSLEKNLEKSLKSNIDNIKNIIESFFKRKKDYPITPKSPDKKGNKFYVKDI
jgi:hypothetical protein